MTPDQICDSIIALCAGGIAGILVYAATKSKRPIVTYQHENDGPPLHVEYVGGVYRVTLPDGYRFSNRARTVTFKKKTKKNASN